MSKTVKFASLNFLNKAYGYSERLKTLQTHLLTHHIEVIALQEIFEEKIADLDAMMKNLGYFSSVSDMTANPNGIMNGNAIYSKYPILKEMHISFHDVSAFTEQVTAPIPTTVVEVDVNGSQMFFMSSHFAWGSTSEGFRLAQAVKVSEVAEQINQKTGSPVVFGGDMNATPASDTYSYMTGNKAINNKSHLWVDAFISKGNPEEWVTSDADTFYGIRTAIGSQKGKPIPIIADFPKRRIDYIMSYGWCYGRPGGFTFYTRFGTEKYGNERELSDHYGVLANVITP